MKAFLRLVLLLLVVTLYGHITQAQQPAALTIGERVLKHVEVYSIITTKQGDLYVATNQGVYTYRHAEFVLLQHHPQVAGRSLFGLVEDATGTLYCHDISGQIYRLESGVVVPDVKIPEQFVSNRMKLFCDEQGRLHFFSKRYCFQLEGGKLTSVKPIDSRAAVGVELSQLIDGSILIATERSHAYQKLTPGGLENVVVDSSGLTDDRHMFRSFFRLGSQLVVAGQDGTFSNDSGSWEYEQPHSYKNQFFPISKQEVWGLRSTRGLNAFRWVDDQLKVSEVYFEDQFISTCWVAADGTIYLGTFGDGVLVIPNQHMECRYASNGGATIRDFAVAEADEVYASQMGKGIVKLDQGESTILQPEQSQFYSRLFWSNTTDFSLLADYPGLYFDVQVAETNQTLIPTAQAVASINRKNYLVATAKGIWLVGDPASWNVLDWNPQGRGMYNLQIIPKRVQSIALDRESKTLFASDLKGTYRIDSNGVKKALQVSGVDFISAELRFEQGSLWCATVNQGILEFRHGELVESYQLAKDSMPARVRQLAMQDGVLYALIDNYIAVQQIGSDTTQYVGCAMGVCADVSAFSLTEDRLWLLLQNSDIVSTRLPLQFNFTKDIPLRLRAVSVNGQAVAPTAAGDFPYDQNEFTFEVDIVNAVLVHDCVIRYRVRGFETQWNTTVAQEKAIKYKYLPPGAYVFEYYAEYNGRKGSPQTYAFTVAPPFWSRWWFMAAMVILLLATMALFFFIWLQTIRKRQREELLKRELKADFVEAELRALRAQMNPHFIFNALSSIQALILNAEIESSYDYLVLFSKLVRKTLTFSNEEFISLESEIEFLRIYLKLEKLRFHDDFNYTLDVSGETDSYLPSLMIQPIVENALIHGLQHKTSNKELHILFEVTEDYIRCVITDNGIGRSASQKINERQGKKHDSFALESIQKRLDMYRGEFGPDIGCSVTDLTTDGKACGTVVEFVLPVRTFF